MKELVSIELEKRDCRILIFIRENFINKQNRGICLSITPHDLEHIEKVGELFVNMGQKILDEVKENK